MPRPDAVDTARAALGVVLACFKSHVEKQKTRTREPRDEKRAAFPEADNQ